MFGRALRREIGGAAFPVGRDALAADPPAGRGSERPENEPVCSFSAENGRQPRADIIQGLASADDSGRGVRLGRNRPGVRDRCSARGLSPGRPMAALPAFRSPSFPLETILTCSCKAAGTLVRPRRHAAHHDSHHYSYKKEICERL